jgi:CubicO group peptidase (beta-lactamase class C family)
MPSLHSHLTLFLILCILSQPTAARAQSPEIDAALADLLQQENLMGLSVVTFCGDALTGSYHHGLRHWEDQLPVTPATVYRMASVSKAATAVACMRLVESGDLDLDLNCSNYLGFALEHPLHPGVAVTPRMLLSHTSGLRDGSGYSPFLQETTDGDADIPPLAALVVPGGAYYTSNMWGTPAPGTYFQYSNLNFGVLAAVMEAATGLRFDVLMDTWLLAPLGCNGGYNVSQLAGIADLAVLYRNQGGWTPQADDFGGVAPPAGDWANYVPGTNGLLFGPQGGLRITAEEMARIAAVWGDGAWNGVTLLSPESVAQMHAPAWTSNGANGNDYYGLFQGWGLGLHRAGLGDSDAIIPGEDVAWIGHPGEAYGLISDAYVDVTSGWGFVFATNGAWNGYTVGNTAWYTVEEQVFETLAPDWQACAAGSVSPVLAMVARAEAGKLAPNPGAAGESVRWLGPDAPVAGEPIEWWSASGQILSTTPAGPDGLIPAPPSTPGVYWVRLPLSGRTLPWVFAEVGSR